jgi:hypothetical protein
MVLGLASGSASVLVMAKDLATALGLGSASVLAMVKVTW